MTPEQKHLEVLQQGFDRLFGITAALETAVAAFVKASPVGEKLVASFERLATEQIAMAVAAERLGQTEVTHSFLDGYQQVIARMRRELGS